MKIIADDKIPYLRDELEPFVDIEYLPGKAISPKDVKDADALIIRTRTQCNANLLEGSRVKFIATATIGFDHIDTEYCKAKNIAWTNAPGCNSGSVKQYVAAALLLWAKEHRVDLTERVLGVVGVGNVGTKIVGLAETLNMRVLLNDPPRSRESGACGFISLDGLLREADIVSFHVPLNRHGEDKTFHMADEVFFSKLNNSSLVINTSRGEVVDQHALQAGFATQNTGSYILDVWENEPEIDLNLLEHAFLGTPHIAGYSQDGKALGTTMSVRALSRFFALGIDDWEPANLPAPERPTITIDGNGKSFQEVATEAVLATYDIRRDDNALRNNVSDFERLRGEYPVRREFGAYTIIARNMPDEFRMRLEQLGFRLQK